MATDEARQESGEIRGEKTSGRGGVRRGTRAQALERIFETAVKDDEGFRHGVLGKPRVGKTYHLKEVVDEARDRGLCELTLIHDCKRLDVQYAGIVRADRDDLRRRPLTEEDVDEHGRPRYPIVFHGRPELNVKCSVDDVGRLGLEQGRQGTSTHVLADELYHALKARQVWLVPPDAEGSAMGEILREGSSQRVSSSWTTQYPAALPTECLDMTETFAIFRLSGRSLRYIMKMLELPDDAAAVIKSLQRGEFILATDDDWDGVIYGPA